MNAIKVMLSLLAIVMILSTCSGYPYKSYGYGYGKPDQGTECNAVADIVFLYDRSGSIVSTTGDPQENFNKMKQFMSAVVDEFSPVGPNGAQFAALSFSTDVLDHFYLNQHGSAEDVKDAIANLVTSPNSGTSIGKGLEKIQDEYFLSGNGGKRECAKEFVILLTDGHNSGAPFPVPIAQELKNDGVTIITVGIGNDINHLELEAIASPGFKFDVGDFSALSDEIDAIVLAACAACECTSQTGGYHYNKVHKKKYGYGKVSQTVNVNVPVSLRLSPHKSKQRKAPYSESKTGSPSYGKPNPKPVADWY